MKRQTTANTATPVWDIEHERADDDSWVASFESEVKPAAAPARPKRSRLRFRLSWSVSAEVLIAGWFVWQTWTATPAASAAPLTTVAAFRDRGLQVGSRRRVHHD